MNKKTAVLTTEQFKDIINTIREGSSFFRPNDRTATILVLEGNLGLRISDILNLTLSNFIYDNGRYFLDIIEKKSKKRRITPIPSATYKYIANYCLRNKIRKDEKIFHVTARSVQKHLAIVCEYLGYDGISTHSFRKWYATELYKNNGYDVALVQQLLQHSSIDTTRLYIGIDNPRIMKAIDSHVLLC